MQLLIHKKVLGTDLHLLTDPTAGTVQWKSKIPESAWVVGDRSHVGSIEDLLDVLGETPIDLFPMQHLKAFEEVCDGNIDFDIPWRWILSDEAYMDRINHIIEKSRINVCALEESKYDQTYKSIRKFLLSLKEPLIDVEKLASYVRDNDKGMTIETALRSFSPVEGRAPKITYDQSGTATGRLTVKSGPRILTLPSRHRDIITAKKGCEIVQIDLVSAEPRTAFYVAGKGSAGDVYQSISRELNLDLDRDVVKVASLSALYGAGSQSLTKLVGSRVTANRLINSLRELFGVRRIESQLTSEMKNTGCIRNLFGRKLMTRTDEIQKAYSHFMQSTTSDAAILMFEMASESIMSDDENFEPYYVIHDAMVCQITTRLKEHIQEKTKILNLPGVGMYDTKMSSLDDN